LKPRGFGERKLNVFAVAEGPHWTLNRIAHKTKGFSANFDATLAPPGPPDVRDRTDAK
jgi:hypothetical protein